MTSLYVGKGFFINAESVEIVQEWGSRVSERVKKRAVDREEFYDACRGKPIRCLITLKIGWVIACPNSPETLVSRPLIRPPIKPSVRGARDHEEKTALRDLLNGSTGDCVQEQEQEDAAAPPPKHRV